MLLQADRVVLWVMPALQVRTHCSAINHIGFEPAGAWPAAQAAVSAWQWFALKGVDCCLQVFALLFFLGDAVWHWWYNWLLLVPCFGTGRTASALPWPSACPAADHGCCMPCCLASVTG
jgi:hypothetical protein